MRFRVCGAMNYRRREVERLVHWARTNAPIVLGDAVELVDEVRIVVNPGPGLTENEWVEPVGFDLVDGRVVTVTMWRSILRDAAVAKYWFVHELFHARQQLEGRLRRRRGDWTSLKFRRVGDSVARRYDRVRAVYRRDSPAGDYYIFQRYRDTSGVGREGSALPWELENLRAVRKLLPDLHRKRWGSWYPR